MSPTNPHDCPRIDWGSFYRNYRKPGFVEGYEILHKLGSGVFGIVFKARKESIGKDYAIKFLKLDEEAVRDAVLRELDSVRYFAQVDHPNLVSIEDKGEVAGIPYIVMGYAGDETLASRLLAGPMPRAEAMAIFVQIARGLRALHDHSLAHFDLKPANVFMRGNLARIGDYGLSKLVSFSHNSLSFGRGTPYYMAPELLHRRGDARSDIYSLGVILYECLTGKVPFQGDSEWEVLRKHEQQEPEFPAEIGASERVIIERCLRKDPEQRYQGVDEILAALQAAARPASAKPSTGPAPRREQDTAPPAAPRAEDAYRPRRDRRRGLLASLAIAGLVMLLIPVLIAKAIGEKRRQFRVSVAAVHSEAQDRSRRIQPRLHYPQSSTPACIRLAERTMRDLRRKKISVAQAYARLKTCAKTAAVHGANTLVSLDYRSRGDTDIARMLHALLDKLTGFRFEFELPPRRGKIPRDAVKRNETTAEKFWNRVRSQYSSR